MPVPSDITALSTTAASNSPPGSESPSSIDDYLRSHASFIAQLRAVIGGAVNANIPTSSLGVEQDYQNVTGSRAFGTTYTNSSGRPIEVSVSTNSVGTGTGTLTVTVGGVAIQAHTSSYRSNANFTVPNGDTYSVAATTFTLASWSELR